MILYEEKQACWKCSECGRTWEIGEDPSRCHDCEPLDAWVATVHIMVHGSHKSTAEDAISELLSGATDDPESSHIVDWGYARIFNHLLSPSPFGKLYLHRYEEGDFLKEMEG